MITPIGACGAETAIAGQNHRCVDLRPVSSRNPLAARDRGTQGASGAGVVTASPTYACVDGARIGDPIPAVRSSSRRVRRDGVRTAVDRTGMVDQSLGARLGC